MSEYEPLIRYALAIIIVLGTFIYIFGQALPIILFGVKDIKVKESPPTKTEFYEIID